MACFMSSVPGVGASTMPSHECFCCSMGGGVQDVRMRPRAGTFMPMMGIGCVDRHEDGVKRIATNGLDQRLGTEVSGDAEEADHLLVAGFEQGFHRAALGEYLLDLVVGTDVVQLPKVEVICIEQLQRLLQHAERTGLSAFSRLAGEEGF